jgi:concanavalin A-like lectin/glucanase superfamily protein
VRSRGLFPGGAPLLPLILTLACSLKGGGLARPPSEGTGTPGPEPAAPADAALPPDDAEATPDAGEPAADAPVDAAALLEAAAAPVDAETPDVAATPDTNHADEDPAGTCPARPGLALCLRFEKSIADESPSRTAIAPAIIDYADGPSGAAADLRPGTQITIADNALFYSQAVTIEAWVSPRVLAHDTFIVDHQGQYSLAIHADGTAICSGAASAARPSAVQLGVWTSLTCTFDSTSVALWIDGVKTVESPGGRLPSPSASRLTVGWGGPPEWSFEGLLDNVRLWRQVRTAGQICAGALRCPGALQSPP